MGREKELKPSKGEKKGKTGIISRKGRVRDCSLKGATLGGGEGFVKGGPNADSIENGVRTFLGKE